MAEFSEAQLKQLRDLLGTKLDAQGTKLDAQGQTLASVDKAVGTLVEQTSRSVGGPQPLGVFFTSTSHYQSPIVPPTNEPQEVR